MYTNGFNLEEYLDHMDSTINYKVPVKDKADYKDDDELKEIFNIDLT